MKRISLITAALLSVSMFCGCASVNINIKKPADTQPADLSDFPQLTSEDYDLSRYDDDKNMYFECHSNTWTLKPESADKYPKLAEALKKVDEHEKKYFTDNMDESDADARQFYADNKQYDNDAHFSCYSDIGIACADPKHVSLVSTLFTFLGGAHPSTVSICYNIDVASGQFIPLSAVISDKKGLDEILKDALKKQYPDREFFELDESLRPLKMALPAFETDDPTYNFSFNPNGLTFYFDPAEISAYAEGGEQIDLTYDDLAPVLDKNFTF